MPKQRLQVFLSHNGVCSRRQAMDFIQKGNVKVNGQVVREPSTPVDEKDTVYFQGKLVSEKKYDYVLLNKSEGVTTTTKDPFAEKTVLDLLPRNLQHLNPVGRLDKDTQGLLLLTNDGDIAHKLTHPKFEIYKVYAAEIQGLLKPQDQKSLEEGVILEGKKTAPCRISHVEKKDKRTFLKITLHEGRKRQVRRMLGKFKHRVVSLKRESQGPLTLGDLKIGEWRFLTPQEISKLKAL